MLLLFNSGYYRFHKVVYCVKMCHKIVAKIWKPLDILLRECRGFGGWPSWSRSCSLLLRRPPGIIFVHQLYVVSIFFFCKIHCCWLKKFGGKRGALLNRKNLCLGPFPSVCLICWWKHDTFNPRASTVEPSPLEKKQDERTKDIVTNEKCFVRIYRITQVTKVLSFSL